jgi:hypothetical protein
MMATCRVETGIQDQAFGRRVNPALQRPDPWSRSRGETGSDPLRIRRLLSEKKGQGEMGVRPSSVRLVVEEIQLFVEHVLLVCGLGLEEQLI